MIPKNVMAALTAIEEKKARQRKRIQAAEAQLARLNQEEAEWKRRILVGEVQKLQLAVGDTRSLIDVLRGGTDERAEQLLRQQSEETAPDTPPAEAPAEAGDDEIVKITIRVTGWEKNCIERNVCQTLCRSLNDYARKMLVDGYVVVWDMAGLDGLVKEISFTNRSLNQIAKRVNLLNSVYQGDVFDILQDWQRLRRKLLSALAEVKRLCYLQQTQRGNRHGLCENSEAENGGAPGTLH